MKGKPWTSIEEQMLEQMLLENRPVRAIAKALGKTRDSVRIKIARLGLEEVVLKKNQRTTTTNLVLPAELQTIEDTLKLLNAALTALKTPGLDKEEILRLRGIIGGCKVYKELLADYVDYCGVEADLFDLRAKYAELAKKS